jgi:3-dehydroquinate synthase
VFVQFHLIVVTESGGDSSLRVFGRRFAKAVFRNDEDPAGLRQFDGGTKPRHACADHDEISMDTLNGSGYTHMVQREHMPTFEVQTAQRTYASIVERGILRDLASYIPAKAGKVFTVTTEEVWRFHGSAFLDAAKQRTIETLLFPGGESNKRLAQVELLADEMLERGADRTSIVIGFGGGIVTDVAGFLAAIFMRGVPVLQIPTTLLAQVDAAVGGKTGVNLAGGKNLIGSFHQPLAVLIDPDLTKTLPEREFRAGLFEVVKCGVIRDASMFQIMAERSADVLAMSRELVDTLIAGAVRVKAQVVSADEREGDLRRILNFGHTVGHALEAETGYAHFLHGEAVAWGMIAATHLAVLRGMLSLPDADSINKTVLAYGPLPQANHLDPDRLIARLAKDKKTLQGQVHFVLPTRIGEVAIVSGIEPAMIRQAIALALRSEP